MWKGWKRWVYEEKSYKDEKNEKYEKDEKDENNEMYEKGVRKRTVNMLSDEYFSLKTSEILYASFRLSTNFSLS